MIRLDQISKSYGTRELFKSLTYHFPQGEKIALVGDNGAGKSTLLNIICSLEHQDSGKIIQPNSLQIGYLRQNPGENYLPTILEECSSGELKLYQIEKQLQNALTKLESNHSPENLHKYQELEQEFQKLGGYMLSTKAKTLLLGLGFSNDQLEKSPTILSGGWKMRLELAKLFMSTPDFLVLDEPTNHLDLPSLVWVEKYLQNFQGTLLFVSHDKALLNRLSTLTLHLDQGHLQAYSGNFDFFLKQKEINDEHNLATFNQLEKKKKQLSSFIDRFGAKATKAKQAQSKQKQIDKMSAEQENIDLARAQSSISLTLPDPLPVERIVCNIQNIDIGYSSPLAFGVKLQIERGQKIAIIGANGIGKSTLLKTITQKIPPLRGEVECSHRCQVSYFSQDQLETLNEDHSIVENVMRLSGIAEPEARNILGNFLFSGEDVFKKVKILSGGEKSRVGLATVLAQKSNFLILDEPTNHLDMSSVDQLTSALSQYKGTILFVSHDRVFIDSLCTHVFAMVDNGKSMVFEGNLDDYRQLSTLCNFPNVLDPGLDISERPEKTKPKTENKSADFKRLKSFRSRLEKDLRGYEKKNTQYEMQIAELDNQLLATDPSDFKKIKGIQDQKLALQALLNSSEDEWLQKSEELEKIIAQLQGMGRQ